MRLVFAAFLCCALLVTGGCQKFRRGMLLSSKPESQPAVSAEFEGTVTAAAYLEGGQELMVHGYGVVVGLGDKGSSEAPPGIRRLIDKQMRKYALGAPGGSNSSLTTDMLLKDKDTAVVHVTAAMPPGVPKGTKIDVFVQALPQTQTLSLDGGVLWTTELTIPEMRSGGGTLESLAVGKADGAVFVNPFVDSDNAGTSGTQREGRIMGGATILEPRKLRLVLYRADHALAKAIEDKINTRFEFVQGQLVSSGRDPRPRNDKVANAITPAFVEIWIPPQYAKDYRHFLQVIMHLYLRGGATAEEAKARQLSKDILLPTANYEDISLMWEAMGRQYLPVIKDLYTNDNPAVSFYAARAGARLGDRSAVDVLTQMAQSSGSPFQIAATRELGTANDVEASSVLQKLLDSHNELVRLAAYDALCQSRFKGQIQRFNVDDQFTLDVVPTQGEYAIYVTQTQESRIAVFGPGMQVNHPVFFTAPDDLLTLHCEKGDTALKVYRRVGARRVLSDEFTIPFEVKDLIMTLGQLPTRDARKKIRGLGLTYSQVVGVLYRLTKEKAIPAKFVLQKIDPASRIASGNPTVGRPDTADPIETKDQDGQP